MTKNPLNHEGPGGWNDPDTLDVGLWEHKDLGTLTGKLTAPVGGHATVLIKLLPLAEQAKN